MSLQLLERYESRSAREALTTGSATLRYIVTADNGEDELEAKQFLEDTAPPDYDGKLFQDYDWDQLVLDQNLSIWGADVHYGTEDRQETGTSEYEFDTSGGTAHITQSLSTISSYKAGGGTAPNFNGAIGVTEDSIEGCDIITPAFAFSETHYLDPSQVDDAYKLLLFSLTGCVNNTTFKGFAAGECLFLGARGSKRGRENWQINFSFAASPNVTGLSIGSISGIAKAGWDYLWVAYRDGTDQNTLVKKPIAAYVERVQRYADLNALFA